MEEIYHASSAGDYFIKKLAKSKKSLVNATSATLFTPSPATSSSPLISLPSLCSGPVSPTNKWERERKTERERERERERGRELPFARHYNALYYIVRCVFFSILWIPVFSSCFLNALSARTPTEIQRDSSRTCSKVTTDGSTQQTDSEKRPDRAVQADHPFRGSVLWEADGEMKRSKPVFFMERPAAQMAQKTGPPGAPWLTVSPPTHAQTRPSICQPAGPPGGWGGMCGGWSKGSLWDRSYPILVLERTGSRKRDWLGSTWYHLAPLSCSFLETRPYGYFRHICASDTDWVLHAWSEGRGPKRCRGFGRGASVLFKR